MNAKEHINFSYYTLFNLVAGGVLYHQISKGVFSIDLESAISLAVGVGVGSILPDIDHPNSIAGNTIKLHKLRKINKLFNHGGITHTYLINIWIYILGYYLSNWLIYGIALGYFTHLFADDITGNTLPNKWWPLKNLFEGVVKNVKRRNNKKHKSNSKRGSNQSKKTRGSK